MNKYTILIIYVILSSIMVYCGQSPIFIFAHGIFDSKKQADPYKKILGNRIISFNFDDALKMPFIHRAFTTCFGQTAEIEKVAKVYNIIINYFNQNKRQIPPIVLVGLSRGASVILNFLATKQPKHITGAILESPFDHIEYILETMVGKNRMSYSIIRKFFSILFPRYNKNGVQPIHVIEKIDRNIALLFISSLQDQRVPYYHTTILYWILKRNRSPKIFLKIFNQGKHAKILKNNSKEYGTLIKNYLTQVT